MKKYLEFSTTQLSEIARQSKTKKEFLSRIGYNHYKSSYIKEIIMFYKKNLRKVPNLLLKDIRDDEETFVKEQNFKKINYKNGCSVCHKTKWNDKQIPLTLLKEDDEPIAYVCSNCWRIIKEHNIKFSQDEESSKDIFKDFSKEEIETVIKKSQTYYQVIQNLGITDIKNSHLFALIVRCDEENIEVPWDDMSQDERIKFYSPRIRKLKNESSRMMFLSKKLFKKYRCCSCGIGPKDDNGFFLPLQIYHLNGNNQDNRLSNLDLICPNCYDIKRRDYSNNRFKVDKEDKKIF